MHPASSVGHIPAHPWTMVAAKTFRNLSTCLGTVPPGPELTDCSIAATSPCRPDSRHLDRAGGFGPLVCHSTRGNSLGCRLDAVTGLGVPSGPHGSLEPPGRRTGRCRCSAVELASTYGTSLRQRTTEHLSEGEDAYWVQLRRSSLCVGAKVFGIDAMSATGTAGIRRRNGIYFFRIAVPASELTGPGCAIRPTSAMIFSDTVIRGNPFKNNALSSSSRSLVREVQRGGYVSDRVVCYADDLRFA